VGVAVGVEVGVAVGVAVLALATSTTMVTAGELLVSSGTVWPESTPTIWLRLQAGNKRRTIMRSELGIVFRMAGKAKTLPKILGNISPPKVSSNFEQKRALHN
jgi:hypothetical protein